MNAPALPRNFLLPTLLLFSLLPFATVSAQFSKTFVPKNSVWKYAPDYIDRGTAWRAEVYPAADSWPSGAGAIGYGDDADTFTDLPVPPGNKPITLYFRHTFTVSASDKAQSAALFLSVRRDDGAVVYLNGIELARFNMPAGTIVNTTLASSGVGGGDETAYFDSGFTPAQAATAASRLKTGTNVLAVELHQVNVTSSDTQFDMELVGAEIPVNFGTVKPGRKIEFEDSGRDGGFQLKSFERDPGVIPPHTDYNWLTTATPQLTAIIGSDYAVLTQSNDLIDLASYEFVVSQGTANFTSENIDTRNYKDVKVAFGVRTTTEIGAFDGSDSLVIGARTSVDGVGFAGNVVAKSFIGGSPAATTTLIASTSTKKALVALNNTHITASPNWTQFAYNDTAWPFSGTNGVGYERGSGYETLIGTGLDVGSAMYNINQSAFIRVKFTSPNPSTFLSLQLLMKYDDGFVAYLNGTEVVREHAPAGALAFNAGTDQDHPDNLATNFETFDISAFKNLLVTGTSNVLAIHGLNRGANSSDFLIIPELRGTTAGGSPTFPPQTLNDLRGDFRGEFFFYEASIPDNVGSLYLYANATANATTEYIFLDHLRVTGTPLTVDSFDSWIQLTTTLDRGEIEGSPEGNPDGDPLANLLEYGFGGAAQSASLVSAQSGLPLAPIVTIVPDSVQGSNLKFVEMNFRMLDGTISGMLSQPIGGLIVRDLKYIPQIGESRVNGFGAVEINWKDGASGNTVAQQVGTTFVENGDGTRSVKVRFLTAISPGTTNLFVRLLVQQVIN